MGWKALRWQIYVFMAHIWGAMLGAIGAIGRQGCG
jgi:hypothetical protein